MALSAQIIALIRDEIGNDDDFSDNSPHTAPQLDSLENVYVDTERGNFSILRTALICWRRRLHNLQARSFDVSTEGTLLNRNQRIRFMERQISKLQALVDSTYKGYNAPITTPLIIEEGSLVNGVPEF